MRGGWTLWGGLWLIAAALCAIGDWLAGLGLAGSLAGLYGVSLRWPWRACRRCEGSNKRRGMGGLFGGIYAHGCRSRFCYQGDRMRWGVLVLQPGRAKAERQSRGG